MKEQKSSKPASKDIIINEELNRYRAMVKNLEDDKKLLKQRNECLVREIEELKSEIDKRLPLEHVKDSELRKLVEKLQTRTRQLEEENKDLKLRISEKDDSNAKIANLCNILLQDKTSLIEANRRLADSLQQMQNTIKHLEESNRKLQERIEETRKTLGLNELKTNF